MLYKENDIKRDVLVALDMGDQSTPLLVGGDVDEQSVADIIGGHIVESVKAVELSCPPYMLHTGHNFGESVFWGDDGTWGYVQLPDDFMRLIVFRMSDWERPVYGALMDTDPEYALQKSRWRGLRGCVQKPVCVLVTRAEGLFLEFYSCLGTEARVEQAVYRPLPRMDRGAIDISPRCHRAVIYHVAALTAQTLGMESAASLFELSKNNMT